MAINVDTVYKTVLLILNKEQRGYMTPQEFNSIGTQVQLEIFEKYFEDLNQDLRVPQTDIDYSDRVENLDEKIAIFKTFGTADYNFNLAGSYFTLPVADAYNTTVNGILPTFYRLGSVVYTDVYGRQVELDRLQRNEYYNIQTSPLTASTKAFPTYLYENQRLFVSPKTIVDNIGVNYIRKPMDVIWGFIVGSRGQYIYNPNPWVLEPSPPYSTGSINFELHVSEQTHVIMRILMYAGVVINDPQVIQVAAQQVQAEQINSKS
jgi:hypothetical protein